MECGVGRCWQSRVCLKSAVTGCSLQLWATESFDQRDFIYYPKGNKTRKRNLLSIGTSLRLSRTQLLNVLVVAFLSSPSCLRSSKSWLAEERWATRRYESGKKYLFCFKKSSVLQKLIFMVSNCTYFQRSHLCAAFWSMHQSCHKWLLPDYVSSPSL